MKQRKRVVIVSQMRVKVASQPWAKGFDEAVALSRRGLDVVFVCFSGRSQAHHSEFSRVTVHYVPWHVKWNLGPLTIITSFLTCFRLFHSLIYICSKRPSVVRAEGTLIAGLPVGLFCRLSGIPYIVWLGGDEDANIRIKLRSRMSYRILRPILWFSQRFVVRRACAVLCTNHKLEVLAKSLGSASVIDIGNYVDMETFRAVPDTSVDSSSQMVFLYVGRLEREKGVDILIRALSSISTLGTWRAVIVGKGTEEKVLRQLVTELKLKDKVNFLGEIDHSKLPKLISTANVLVIPSLTEGLPAVALEGLASGLYIVASSVGGLPSLLQSSDVGTLVRPGDVDALANVLGKIVNGDIKVEGKKHARRDVARRVSSRFMETYLREIEKCDELWNGK